MAPHLTPGELDKLQEMGHAGKTPDEARAWLRKQRAKAGVKTPTVNNVRRAMAGKTFKRGGMETRGRKKLVTAKRLVRLESARVSLQKTHEGKREVTMSMILRRARVDAAASTVSKALKDQLGVQWRSCREKAMRTWEQEQVRKEWCSRKRRLPANYFFETVDLIIDCKKYDLPLNVRAQDHAARRKVRG